MKGCIRVYLVTMVVAQLGAQTAPWADQLEYLAFDAPVLDGASALSVRFAEVSETIRQNTPSYLQYHWNAHYPELGDPDGNRLMFAPLSLALQVDDFAQTGARVRLGGSLDPLTLTPFYSDVTANLYSVLGMYQLSAGLDLLDYLTMDVAYWHAKLRVAHNGSDAPEWEATREASRLLYQARLNTGKILRQLGWYPFLDSLRVAAPVGEWIRGYHAVAGWQAGVLDGLVSWGYSDAKEMRFGRFFVRDRADLVEATAAWQSDGSPAVFDVSVSPVNGLFQALNMPIMALFQYYHIGFGYSWPQEVWLMRATALAHVNEKNLFQILLYFPFDTDFSNARIETSFLISL